jgi:hypothetical protein
MLISMLIACVVSDVLTESSDVFAPAAAHSERAKRTRGPGHAIGSTHSQYRV